MIGSPAAPGARRRLARSARGRLRAGPDRGAAGMTEIRLAVEIRGDADRVATVTADNPAKLNILDPAGIAALERTFLGLAAYEDLPAVVLRGSGSRAFI